jgi:hypothetical protein
MGSSVLRIEVFNKPHSGRELTMSKTNTVSPLRQRMLEDMAARKLNPATQRAQLAGHWQGRSDDRN